MAEQLPKNNVLDGERTRTVKNMRTRASIAFFALLGALFLLLPAARADIATLTFKGPNGYYEYGIYTDPYKFDVEYAGSTTPGVWLWCDDFADEIWANDKWKAEVISGSASEAVLETTRIAWLAAGDQLGSGKTPLDLFNSGTSMAFLYNVKAYLELNAGSSNQSRADASWALWYLFMPNAVTSYLTKYDPSYVNTLGTMVTNAKGVVNGDANADQDYRNRLTIYSPGLSTNGEGWNTVEGTSRIPQEFNQVRVPDGGVTLILLGAALVGLETLRRRLRA